MAIHGIPYDDSISHFIEPYDGIKKFQLRSTHAMTEFCFKFNINTIYLDTDKPLDQNNIHISVQQLLFRLITLG